MDFNEFIALIISMILAFRFFFKWFNSLRVWRGKGKSADKFVLASLPVAAFFIILVTLRTVASVEVVDDGFWIFFYLVFGFAWISCGVGLMSLIFDISWIHDILGNGNNAALAAVAGGFLGTAAIYSASNVGEGPGWWCVLFTGVLGMAVWLLLACVMNKITGIFESITIERDMASGIRFGAYLLASGIILWRACAGDWTSFGTTIIELVDGWPVLLLTAFATAVEIRLAHKAEADYYDSGRVMLPGVAVGVIYLMFAFICVTLLPNIFESTAPQYVLGLWEHSQWITG